MAQLADLYIKKQTLVDLVCEMEKKAEKGISITVSINDDVDNFNQNISAYVSQSKEQREAKEKRVYVGNGKTFWSNKGEFKPEFKGKENKADDLPF